MENRCEKCDGELLEGVLAGLHGLSFYPKGEKDKLVNPKHSSVVCFCCKSCGLIQKMRVTDIEKLNR